MPVENAKVHNETITKSTEGGTVEIRRINNSEIQTFMRCKRKWMLSYYKNLGSDDDNNSNLRVGTLVHAGLEQHYLGNDIMEPIIQEEIAWKTAHADTLNTDVEYPGNPDIELARIMLEGYIPWVEETGKDAHMEVTGVEEELEASLGVINGREVILHGRVDARFKDPDGNTLLLDHKTTSNFGDLADRRLRLNQQLMTYSLLLRLCKGEEVHGAALNMLRKVKRTARAKPPFYDRVSVYFNIETQRNHYKHLQNVVRDILELEDRLNSDPVLTNAAAYPTVDKDCTWKCPFLSICPMFDDGSNIESAVKAMFRLKERV